LFHGKTSSGGLFAQAHQFCGSTDLSSATNANRVLSRKRVLAIGLRYQAIAVSCTIGAALPALALEEAPLIAPAAIWEDACPRLPFSRIGYFVFVPQLTTVDSGRVCHSRGVPVTGGGNIIGGNIDRRWAGSAALPAYR
jgi:hypothetical protein